MSSLFLFDPLDTILFEARLGPTLKLENPDPQMAQIQIAHFVSPDLQRLPL
jgi:hypothetical protein